MAQRVKDKRPYHDRPECLEGQIHPQSPETDAAKGFFGKDGALEEIGLGEGKGQQGGQSIADSHGELRRSEDSEGEPRMEKAESGETAKSTFQSPIFRWNSTWAQRGKCWG